ncbi:MAG: DMT family transporter [Candidatus Lambdaproteobacteria bacterium]|nr:DMT family transporter [Candidatus Lambdaproteobacteria bacterium]
MTDPLESFPPAEDAPPGPSVLGAPVAAAAESRPRPARRIDGPTLAAVLVTILLWGSAFPSTRYVLPHYAPLDIATLRLVYGALGMAVFAAVVRMPLPRWRDWPVCLLFGTSAFALSGLAMTYGLRSVSAGAGSFLVGTIPIFSTILAWLFIRERLRLWGWLGILVSFSGVGLIALGEGRGFRLEPGAGLVVLSAFCQSIFFVFQKPYHRRYSGLQLTCYAVWGGALVMLPLLVRAPAAILAAPLSATLAMIYLGLFPIAVAFATWSYALSRAMAAKVTSAMYVMPVAAVTIAFAWLGEVPSPLVFAGGAVALLGVAVVSLYGR